MDREEMVLKQLTRSFAEGSREFVFRYELAVRLADDPVAKRYVFRAVVTERNSAHPSEYRCEVEIPRGLENDRERLFDAIARAESPVFPVHVPDIVRDELAASDFGQGVTPLP